VCVEETSASLAVVGSVPRGGESLGGSVAVIRLHGAGLGLLPDDVL